MVSPQLAFAPAAFRLICRNQNCHRLPQTTTDCHILPLTATDCHRLLLTATDSNTLQQTPRDCHRMPETARDCQSLPQIATDRHHWHQFCINLQFTDRFWIVRTVFGFLDYSDVSRLSGQFLYSLDSFKVVWKVSRLWGQFLGCPETFWTIQTFLNIPDICHQHHQQCWCQNFQVGVIKCELVSFVVKIMNFVFFWCQKVWI